MKKFGPVIVVVLLLATMFFPMIAINMFSIGLDDESLSENDFSNFSNFVIKLKNSNSPVSQFLLGQLEQSTRTLLDDYDNSADLSEELQDALIEELNDVLKYYDGDGDSVYDSIYDPTRFAGVTLERETEQLRMQAPSGADLVRLNLLLLKAAYPQEIKNSQSTAPSEITVGLIVILRATFRRLLRGFSTSILQTTLGTFSRTSARAVTRRFVRFIGRVLFGSIVQESEDEAEGQVKQAVRKVTFWGQFGSLAFGFIGLCLSFWGILHVIPSETTESLIGSRGLSKLEAVILAGLPLLGYAFLHKLFGKKFGVQTGYATEIDGLVLQGYFTGAGSFLPMTTDLEYYGETKDHWKLASAALVGMFCLFVVCYIAGEVLDMGSLNFLGSMFLIYCFVYSFPIEPLEGQIVWAHNKLLWLAIILPIVLAFANYMDGAFGDIL